jgi:hypothetical protein
MFNGAGTPCVIWNEFDTSVLPLGHVTGAVGMTVGGGGCGQVGGGGLFKQRQSQL